MPRQNRADDSFDGHFRPSQLNALSSKELLDYSRSQLLEEQTAYANFCADLGNCQHFIIYVGATEYRMLALKAGIYLCVYDGVDYHTGLNNSRFNKQFTTTVNMGTIADDGRPAFFQISYYLHQTEQEQGCVFGSGSYMHNVLDLTGTTYTQREIWSRYKHVLYQAYVDDAPPAQIYPSGSLMESGASQEEPFNPAANSIATWAEMPGIYTAYVDNVGVFLPVGFPIDAEMTSQKEVSEPWLMEYVYCKRNPNAGESQNLSLLQGFAGQIPFVSSVTGGMVSMQQFTRILLPRLRAFGRQTTPAPTYEKYKSDMNAHGVTEVLDDLGGTFKKSFAPVVMLSNASYEAFVGKLESFNVIPNRNGVTSSGGRPTAMPGSISEASPIPDTSIEGPPENQPDLHIGAFGYRPGDENNPYRVYNHERGRWEMYQGPIGPDGYPVNYQRRRRRW